MTVSSVFTIPQSKTINAIHYDNSGLYLPENVNRHVFAEEVITSGKLAGQICQISLMHPLDFPTVHALSEKIVAYQTVPNFKHRDLDEIANNGTIDLIPKEEKGGLIVGVSLKQTGRMVAMGGVLQIVEENDGGRGINFKGCPLNSQSVLNMAGTDPEFHGENMIAKPLPYRFKILSEIAKNAPHRTHVVIKVSHGTPTYDFYINKVGFEDYARAEETDKISGKKVLLTTLVAKIDVLDAYMEQKHLDIHTQKLDLHSLHAYHKTSATELILDF